MEWNSAQEWNLSQSSWNKVVRTFSKTKKTLTNISSYEVMQIVMQIFVEIVRVATRGAIESIKV